jgi:hypothetical protein
MNRINFLVAVVAVISARPLLSNAAAAILFESGTLGPTGIQLSDLLGGAVPGTNVNSGVFPGVRFELTQPVSTSMVGGHFIARTPGTFFGAIIALDDENDFPNSDDLSTPDVLGVTTLTFPDPSDEVFGDLELNLDSGWYALVFGSGLFGTSATGGAVRNGMDIGDPAYIAFELNAHWFNLDDLILPFDNHRFVVTGELVPEPSSIVLVAFAVYAFAIRSIIRKR